MGLLEDVQALQAQLADLAANVEAELAAERAAGVSEEKERLRAGLAAVDASEDAAIAELLDPPPPVEEPTE